MQYVLGLWDGLPAWSQILVVNVAKIVAILLHQRAGDTSEARFCCITRLLKHRGLVPIASRLT